LAVSSSLPPFLCLRLTFGVLP